MNKKGVSPLIATVLLIAFAVALGAIVMNWGRTYVEEQTDNAQELSDQKTTCSFDVNIKILEISNQKKLCYNSTAGTLDLTVDNRGRKTIESFEVLVYNSTEDIAVVQVNQSINIGRPLKQTITHGLGGDLDFIRVTPQVRLVTNGALITCTESEIKDDDLSPCT
ncbi:hypothetical protein GOV04_00025 [Candidatus Woesearchaeota archaeon]|nr:hypothetical protein [Candidatus Woesearchaeota archaeon]